MIPPRFISRINWRQILVHFVAFWFFIYAFQTLSYLYDTKLVDTIRYSNSQDSIKTLTDNGTTTSNLVFLQLYVNISGLIGLLIAFMISLAISIKKHWLWINPLIAFALMYTLYRFDLLGWTYLKQTFWFLGQRFRNSTAEFLLNGTILLTIGLLIFLLKHPNRFIEKQNGQ